MSNNLDPKTEELLQKAEEDHLRETRQEVDKLESWRAWSEKESQKIYLR